MWKDPKEPTDNMIARDDVVQEPLPQSMYGGGMPPTSAYGNPGQTWNKETMELLVDIEIPKISLASGGNEKLLIWTKKVLMQIQFGNYTSSDQKKMIKDLRYILILAQQEGNDQIVFEEQMIFIMNMQISKGRSDKPDGLRERTMWIMQILKNVFSNDDVKKPDENSSKLNIPFGGR
jgi:hypothetical protein